jgi:hypothetical protein
MKLPILKKLQEIGNTIKKDVYFEKKSGMPIRFKVPQVQIKWNINKSK